MPSLLALVVTAAMLGFAAPAGARGAGFAAVSPKALAATDFSITQNDQAALFVQGVTTPNAVVRIAGNVNLDLSGQEYVHVAPGVQIIGDRSSNPRGPRLFTTTFPHYLLMVGDDNQGTTSDNVRITGIRLDGGQGDESASSDTADADGIVVMSSLNVTIDHNEIYGWRGAAVAVHDAQNRIDVNVNPYTVWVHDNFIHHNQHYTGEIIGGGHGAGYGVENSYGAYALIERNVFDYNRHAIAGDGREGTGYYVQNNLILPNGGDNTSILSTHIIDMHGRESCGLGSYNCGLAGEHMVIGYNTIIYDDGTAIKLRGAPTDGMYVHHNVFAHSDVWGSDLDDAALVQTVGDNGQYIHQSNNTFGLDTFHQAFKSCDFDGDGALDRFMATGVTWWYTSSRLGGRWTYLAQSPRLAPDVTLSDVNGDGRCDATADGVTTAEHPDGSPIAAARNSDGRVELFGSSNVDAVSHTAQTEFSSETMSPWSQLLGSARSVAAETSANGRLELFGVARDGHIFQSMQTTPNGSTWTARTQLDGLLTSIAVTHWPDGRIEMFGTNASGQIFHRLQAYAESTSWSGWTQFDGAANQVAAEVNENGRIEVFIVNAAGQIFRRTQTAPSTDTWTPWTQMDGLLSTVAATRNYDGRMELFGTNSVGQVFYRSQVTKGSSAWTGWTQLDGTFTQVAVETNADGRIELFGVNPLGQVYHRQQQWNDGWSGWVPIGTQLLRS